MMKKEISLSENAAVTLKAAPQETLFRALQGQKTVLEDGCNGKGRCGRCRVKYLTAAPMPAAAERRFFSAQELREGMRLACLHPVKEDCLVEPMYVRPAGVQIVAETPEFQGLEGKRMECGSLSVQQDRSAKRAEGVAEKGQSVKCPGCQDAEGWCIAIDLGTTTIAMQARNLADSAVLGVWKSMNPQRSFGSDVISRMQAANEGNASELKSSVEAVLAAGIRELAAGVQACENGRVQTTGGGCACGREGETGYGGLKGIYLAGNTVMEHLLAGLSVERLSRHPFSPVTLEEQRIGLSLPAQGQGKRDMPAQGQGKRDMPAQGQGKRDMPAQGQEKRDMPAAEETAGGGQCICTGQALITLLPGFSAFVGADLLAGVLACSMHQRDGISMLIDLGTNGEIVLGNRKKLLCTATAAGPAFEGGPGSAASGTDMIAVIAQLLDAGIVDETGLLADPWFETGIDWKTVRMTQEQIRAIQMAKAAVYAGICILTKEYGISFSDIESVYLAGGFGYYLDVEKAARIGLFPDELKDRVTAVGNTSLKGAYLYGRNASKEEAARIRKVCTAINLAEHADFEEIYLEHLNLG